MLGVSSDADVTRVGCSDCLRLRHPTLSAPEYTEDCPKFLGLGIRSYCPELAAPEEIVCWVHFALDKKLELFGLHGSFLEIYCIFPLDILYCNIKHWSRIMSQKLFFWRMDKI